VEWIAFRQSPSPSALWLREQSRVPSLGPGYVVPGPQTVLLTPPTPTTAHRDFGLPYTRQLVLLQHHRDGSPALGCSSSTACRPCYPGRSPAAASVLIAAGHRPSPYVHWVGIFELLTRLHLGSLALRPAVLPIGNLRPPVARTPLP